MLLMHYNEHFECDFIKLPKFLFNEREARELSLNAKVLYAALLDRSKLSSRNGWVDKENRVFVRFTLSDVCTLLSCTTPTAIKAYKELEKIGLIEKKKGRKGYADTVYVMSYIP